MEGKNDDRGADKAFRKHPCEQHVLACCRQCPILDWEEEMEIGVAGATLRLGGSMFRQWSRGVSSAHWASCKMPSLILTFTLWSVLSQYSWFFKTKITTKKGQCFFFLCLLEDLFARKNWVNPEKEPCDML